MNLATLFKKLQKYEMELKILTNDDDEEEYKKKKNLALKDQKITKI